MSFFDGKLQIEAASASGLEAVTKRELIKLGYAPNGAEKGRITFEGTYLDVMRANIFLRTANRIRIVLARFPATTFDELFENTIIVRWQDILPNNAKIIVSAKSAKSALFALSSIQSIVKKAILTSLSTSTGAKTFNEDGTEYEIEVALSDNIATIALDTSGDGLHKRGYRTYVGEAPLRETLAAGMILLSVWRAERPLIDPFCGSGTIPIEAAMIGMNIASGINRGFRCEQFEYAPHVRKTVQQEAEQLINHECKLRISGFDINPDAIRLALRHADKAGVSGKVHFQVADMRTLSSHYSYGIIITNPPYGERLMQEDELRALYRDFGIMYRSLDRWCAYAITSYRGFEKYFGKHAERTRKLYNSELECTLYQYLAPKPQREREIAAKSNTSKTDI